MVVLNPEFHSEHGEINYFRLFDWEHAQFLPEPASIVIFNRQSGVCFFDGENRN